jgi:hypothetical protein
MVYINYINYYDFSIFVFKKYIYTLICSNFGIKPLSFLHEGLITNVSCGFIKEIFVS